MQLQQISSPVDFIRLLYPSSKLGYLSLWDKQTKLSKFIPITKPEQVQGYLEANQDKDLYFGVGLLPKALKGGRGLAEDVCSIPGLWLDVDTQEGSHSAKNLPRNWEHVQELISGMPDPTLVVHTGGGVHLYWLFDKPIIFTDITKAQALSKGWQAAFISRFGEQGLKLDNTSDLARVLRLPGSINHKQDTPKPVQVIHYSGLRYSGEELEPVAQEAIQAQADKRSAKKASPTRIMVTPEDAQAMLRYIPKQLQYDEWLSILMALYSEFDEDTAIQLGTAWSEGYPGEVADKIRSFEGRGYGYTIGTLIHYAIKHGWQPERFDWAPIPVKYEQESRYVSFEEELYQERCLLIKSPKGTGKTEALARLLQGEGKHLRVLIIGHRQALLRSMAHRLGTAFYQEKEGQIAEDKVLAEAQKLAITLDSLWRLPPENRYDLVIIDEAEQVLAHATGHTLREKRAACFDRMQAFCSFATRVVALDADISRISYNYFERLSLGPAVLVNSYKANHNKYLMYETKAGWTESLIRAAEAGDKLFVAANSKQAVKSLSRLLQQRIPDISLYSITADNSTEDGTQAFIVDINQQVQQYQVLLASPSIGTGVSIDAPYFDKVYLYGEADVNTAADLLQQGARVRSILSREVHTWINSKRNLYPTNPEQLQAWAIKNADQTAELAHTIKTNLETGEREVKVDEAAYVALWADVMAIRHSSLNDIKGAFVEAVQAEGGLIEKAQEGQEAAVKAAGSDLKASSRAVKDEFVEAVVAAQPIDYLRYSELKDSGRLTEQERAQVYRFELSDFYGISEEELTEPVLRQLVADDREGLKGKVVSLSLLGATDEELATLDLREIGKGLMAPDKSNYLLARKLRLELLQAAGLEGLPTDKPVRVDPEYGRMVWEKRHKIYSLLHLRIRKDAPAKPLQVVSALLAQLGLKLIHTHKWMRDGTGKRVKLRKYYIDPDRLQAMQALVSRYQAARQQLEHDWIVEGPDQEEAA